MRNNHLDIDIDRLREALVEEAGAAAFGGMPAAMADLVDLESASPEDLLDYAEDFSLDLDDFEI